MGEGTCVVTDRYVHSGVAYSAAKGLPLSWCKAPECGLPAPDVVLFIDVPLDVRAARTGFGEEVYERTAFQLQVRKAFDQLVDASWLVGRRSLPHVPSCVSTLSHLLTALPSR